MDATILVTALGQTLDPSLRQQAEAVLEEASKQSGFTPCLLQITLENGYASPLRQAAALYLKNTIVKFWKAPDQSDLAEGEQPFCLDDQSKAVVRENIVGAIIQCPLLISRQLCVCLEKIIRHDFPEKWTDVVTKIHAFLTSDNQATWLGSLLALEQLAKKYKFKKQEERQPYIAAMKTLLPILYQHMITILSDHSLGSVTLQHHILKIFYASMQYTLSLEIMNENTLPGWMFVFQTIVQRPVPIETLEVDEDDRPELEWWKCKKWTLHILERFVYRYGNPANADKEFSRFAQYYSKTFNAGIIDNLLKQLLDMKKNGGYMSPRVVQGIFNYLLEVVDHAESWKRIKDHFMKIFQEVIFPMMCYSSDDDQLWQDDPYEYIRMKFDIFEDLVSPTVAATHFLSRACSKRKGTLDPVMGACVQILDTPAEQRDPSRKDGALHVIGQVSETLIKRKKYATQLESMLVSHVFPEFTSPLGYMRARACWMIHFFSEITFKNETSLQHGLKMVYNCLTEDKELPVKVEAAVALQFLIKNQPSAETFIQPHVRPIIKELLVVIKETENDDLTNVMQELIETYADQMGEVAVSLCQELVATFNDIVDPNGKSTDEDSYKALTALGILSAIQALVKATFNQIPIMLLMEKTLIQMMATMLRNGVMDFYEEMFALMDLFTTVSISPDMWQMLNIIYETFTRDGFDYFTEIMSVLYNFVKVDTPTFLSNSHNLEAIIEMCKSVMSSSEAGEDPQVHACKLLEVVVLQCHGKIDSYIPSIMGIVLERLTQESKTTELKNMCILVVIAGLYYNTRMMLELLESTRFPDSTESVTAQLFKQWVKDAELFMGVHDRKLSTYGFCSVLQCLLTSPARLPAVVELAPSFIPTIVTQLEALMEAYKDIAGAVDDDDEDGDDMDEQSEKELSSDEDEADEESQQYLEFLAKKAVKPVGGDDVEDSDDDVVQTLMELDYETFIDDEEEDEFQNFKASLEAISSTDPQFYSYLIANLPSEFSARLEAVFLYAEQRKAAKDSRAIEVAGGYKFDVTNVPNTFVFNSP